MAKGTVKWFNNAKGYGFIVPEEGGDDLFVHYSYVNMEGYRTLKAGQAVEYETQEAPKGLHAINIEPIGDTPNAQERQTKPEKAAVAAQVQPAVQTVDPTKTPAEHA